MTTPPIFNDLLFESAMAQVEFYQRLETLPAAEQQRMKDIMGRLSQFVDGVINTFDKAALHWQRWDEWDRTEGEAWRKQMREIQGATEKRKPGRPPKNKEADVPRPPVTGIKRGPGRPSRAQQEIMAPYKEALAELNEFKRQCAEWRKQQIELIDQQIATAIGPREVALEQLKLECEKKLEGG